MEAEKETISISYSGTWIPCATTGSVFDPQQSGDGASGYAMISNGKVTDVQITSEGTEIAKFGNSFVGLSTALKPIRMELGKTLPLGIYAYDPDSMINPLGFVLDINGEEMDTVITGSDPAFFRSLWTPMVQEIMTLVPRIVCGWNRGIYCQPRHRSIQRFEKFG